MNENTRQGHCNQLNEDEESAESEHVAGICVDNANQFVSASLIFKYTYYTSLV